MNRCCASSMEEPLIIGVDDIEPLPPWEASNPKAATVPSLQELVCGVLASHLNCFESLDVLPEHLASVVRAQIQRDRRLLSDDGISVWVEAVMAATSSGTSAGARKLNLRWASSLTDDGLKLLSQNCAHWAAALVELDLGFCEGIHAQTEKGSKSGTGSDWF